MVNIDFIEQNNINIDSTDGLKYDWTDLWNELYLVSRHVQNDNSDSVMIWADF